LLEARFMYAVSTFHKDHRACRGKKILTAYGTIAFGAPFDTTMRRLNSNAHADAACLAVEEIFPRPFAQSAYPTVFAMIDGFGSIVVP
jgi:hypothetical protein